MPSVQLQQQPTSLSEHNLSQIFDVMPSGLVLLDNKGFVSRANPVAKQLLGDDIEQQRWLEAVPRLFSPKADDGHELSLVDGRRVKLSLSPLQDTQGQLIVLTDMTHTRQLQANVAKLQRMSALGNMVASLAHQIRTPLSAAMLYGSNLSNKTLSDNARDNFQNKMMDRLNDLETQVNDMLLFAKSGERMVVNQVSAQQIIEQLQAATEACVRQHQVKLSCVVSTPHAEVLVNANALVSALSNLVENAAQLSAKGSELKVHISCSGEELFISVEDHAGGIDEANKHKIFEPFYTTKQNGTGLGLAVVNSVVKAHHGSIELESNSKGSCFTVRLPLPEAHHHDLAVGGQ
ncbi:sensor histidine kinase [Agarivorans albus]|uniref:histidine kinase n=1 Tax=Agarivorans albus MKT 106 TaxID=1331007 RepID=R9PMY8_AGAAL|nr:ATP-binding protein [Agarivorans albus]GAD02675.1 flagellar sensor histidine kinase FleS [Agarivorans albus MKT 106]